VAIRPSASQNIDVRENGLRGVEGSFRSVAAITSPDSLARVRETKRAAKAAAKEAKS
jgi:hypothetical protein